MDEPKQNWIAKLNEHANQYKEKGMSAYDAIEQVASDFQLNILSEGDACRVYETPDGILVNCWIETDEAKRQVKPGVIFDNNISWLSGKNK